MAKLPKIDNLTAEELSELIALASSKQAQLQQAEEEKRQGIVKTIPDSIAKLNEALGDGSRSDFGSINGLLHEDTEIDADNAPLVLTTLVGIVGTVAEATRDALTVVDSK